MAEQGQRSCTLARAGYYIPGSGATQETACPAGTYSTNAGSSSCSSCPPGFMCPNNGLANPQQCSPGRYSTGGVKDCPRCSAGTFNNIHRSTGCCPCPAGWFNVSRRIIDQNGFAERIFSHKQETRIVKSKSNLLESDPTANRFQVS